MKTPILLCVDDEIQIIKSLERGLRREKYKVLTTTSPHEALQLVNSQSIDLIISDYRMQVMSGIELLSRVSEVSPETKRVILSGYADESLIQEALKDGKVHHYLFKPWDIDELKGRINFYLEKA